MPSFEIIRYLFGKKRKRRKYSLALVSRLISPLIAFSSFREGVRVSANECYEVTFEIKTTGKDFLGGVPAATVRA